MLSLAIAFQKKHIEKMLVPNPAIILQFSIGYTYAHAASSFYATIPL